jgi:hypothetical protein
MSETAQDNLVAQRSAVQRGGMGELPGRSADRSIWPPRPHVFGELLTPIEAAQYLRLDETGVHTPQSAVRTLKYWRDRGELKATKFARRVWYRKAELDRFLAVKTEP